MKCSTIKNKPNNHQKETFLGLFGLVPFIDFRRNFRLLRSSTRTTKILFQLKIIGHIYLRSLLQPFGIFLDRLNTPLRVQHL